jgi:hypothetical protein
LLTIDEVGIDTLREPHSFAQITIGPSRFRPSQHLVNTDGCEVDHPCRTGCTPSGHIRTAPGFHPTASQRSWRCDGSGQNCSRQASLGSRDPRMWPMVTGSNLSALRTIDPTPPQPIASPPGVRVLALDPIWRAAGSISRILPLRDDALEAKLASVIEDIRAVCFQVLIQPQAQRRS